MCIFIFHVTLCQLYLYVKWFNVKCTFMWNDLLSGVPLCEMTYCQVYLYVKYIFMWHIPVCEVYFNVLCNFMSSISLCEITLCQVCLNIKLIYVKCTFFMWNDILCEFCLCPIVLNLVNTSINLDTHRHSRSPLHFNGFFLQLESVRPYEIVRSFR